jgi:hypothetical protein
MAVLAATVACGRGAPVATRPPDPAPSAPQRAAPNPEVRTFSFSFGVVPRLRVRAVSEAWAHGTGPAADSQFVQSTVIATLSVERAGQLLRLTGSVDSISVEPSRLPAAGSGYTRLNLPFAFVGVTSERGQARLRPAADTVGCWSEARTVMDPISALFPSVPAVLQRGQRWRDSLVTSSCRLGVPVRITETRDMVLDSVVVDPTGVARAYLVSYAAATRMEGSSSQQSIPVRLTGSGNWRGSLELDPRGYVARDERSGTFRMQSEVGSVTRQLDQRARIRYTVVPDTAAINPPGAGA